MVTGLLPPARVTGDCDIIFHLPENAWSAVERTAFEVGKELGMPENWLNDNVTLRADCLPDDWRDRRILIVRGSVLSIYAISRIDLIAMKFIAHRPQDLEDLDQLQVRLDDIQFVKRYMFGLSAKGTTEDQITEARELLDSWKSVD